MPISKDLKKNIVQKLNNIFIYLLMLSSDILEN